MSHPSTEDVSLPREHYDAIRRVLELVDGYIREQPSQHTLMSDGKGLMTWAELRPHLRAAIGLLPPKPKKRKRQ